MSDVAAREWTRFDEIISELDENLFRSPEEMFLPVDFLRDPFTPLKEIRDRFGPVVERSVALVAGHPVPNPFLVDESKPIFLVLGYEEAVTVLRDPSTSNAGYAASTEVVFGRSLTMLDGAEHARIRALVLQAFKRSAVSRWTAEVIQPTAAHLVDRLVALGTVDLVRDLAAPPPFAVMVRMLGLAEEDFGRFVKMAIDLLHIGYDPQAALAARDEVTEYFRGEIDKRRSAPTEDLIGMLVDAELEGAQLTDEEILANLRQLLPAGIETTYRTTSNMWVCLLKDRPQYAAIRRRSHAGRRRRR